jgi:soluble lytic murein transglycosylase-like protein
MPATAEWAGPYLLGREIDYVYDAWDNIEAGIAYLSHLRYLTGSDYLALASYFQGSGSVERDGIFTSTRDYALGIIESRDLFATGSLP